LAAAGQPSARSQGNREMSRKRKTSKPETEKAPYQATDREKAALVKFAVQIAAKTPRVKVSHDEKAATISLDHPDRFTGYALLMEALGTADLDFVNGLLGQLANAGSQGNQPDEGGINFLLSIVKGAKPRDQLEAMLAAQMAAVHTATMTMARRLSHAETIQQQDSAERALNKLARTYAMLMEALKRYRTGGEQKVTVQHVSVSEGGQAIVGNVTQAARETAPEKPTNSTPALTDARQPAMPIINEPARVPVPLRRKKKDDGQSST
jgi:hypothetical protein